MAKQTKHTSWDFDLEALTEPYLVPFEKLLTDKMVKSGEILEITILDHLIISTNGYFSFALLDNTN